MAQLSTLGVMQRSLTMTPRWFQLMRAQQLRGRTALTIPFFVGCSRDSLARVVTPPERAREEIHALLHSFLEDSPASHAVSLYRCHDIGQPVALQLFSGYSVPNAASLESRSQGRPTLFVSSEFVSAGTLSLDVITDRLFTELHSHICAAHFSYISAGYVPFTNDDREFIEFSRKL